MTTFTGIRLPTIIRTFSLKVIEHRNPEDKGFVLLPIQDLLNRIQVSAPSNSDRHVPLEAEVEKGKRCSFVDRITESPPGCPGVTFRFGGYIKGEQPIGIRPDFDGSAFDLAPAQLIDVENGELREPATSFNVLAFGRVMVVEHTRGAGGIRSLENCLTSLIRRHVSKDHPRIHLMDVGTREISAAIDRAGGTQEMIMDVSKTHDAASHKFGPTLNDARAKVGGTDLVRLHFKAGRDGSLSKEDVLKAYEDLAADEIDRVILVLRGGAKFVGTEKCKVRKEVVFKEDPSEIAIQLAMAQYLLELQEVHDGVSVITIDGNLA